MGQTAMVRSAESSCATICLHPQTQTVEVDNNQARNDFLKTG